MSEPIVATAPGKIILLGEHAVVYGRPALAIPVRSVSARAAIYPAPPGTGLTIEALDLNRHLSLASPDSEALALTARLVLDRTAAAEPDARIVVQSSIPIASGLGSGAAVSAALARALAAYLGQPLTDPATSDLVYEVEKLHHGSPSGIDNTVICYDLPVYFLRGQAPVVFRPKGTFVLLIGDTGVPSPTRLAVAAVRQGWEQDRELYTARFAAIGQIAEKGRTAIEQGNQRLLGSLMNQNQALLRDLGVSSPELERLVDAALSAGASGAKLSGGGRGGNMIALVAPERSDAVAAALRSSGAVNVLQTRIE